MKIKDVFKNLLSGGDSSAEESYDVPASEKIGDGDIVSSGPAIGKNEVLNAMSILNEYKQGKTNLEARIIANYEWYRMRHLGNGEGKEDNEDNEVSAWLFNSIENKHADAMDNYPEAGVLPREEGDREAAKALSAVIPVCFEQARYKKTYSDLWYDKLQGGTAVTGIFWDRTLADGLGDISIKDVDVLSLYWKPGVKDIQDSPHFFHVTLEDNDLLTEQYPELKERLSGAGKSGFTLSKYRKDDAVDESKESEVIEWYYKKQVGERKVLHYCKFVSDVVLYATENEVEPIADEEGNVIAPSMAESGLYDHGKYPFVFDPLFPVKGSPCGFSYIDVMKACQHRIDRLGSAIIKNAEVGAKRRYFAKKSMNINLEDYADLSKDFVLVEGSTDPREGIMPIEQPQLQSIYLEVYNSLVAEIKETSGNRDFSQGGTTAGVTAYSAIAMLQELGSKLSRDAINASYSCYEEVCHFVLELIRQFYNTKRYFRILGDGGKETFMSFSNKGLRPEPRKNEFGVDIGGRVPIFDIKVKAQRQAPFSKISHNELTMQLFKLGAFNPALADQAVILIDTMDFEGKDALLEKISQNGLMAQQLEAMKKQMLMLAKLAEKAGAGEGIVASLEAQFGISGRAAPIGAAMPSGFIGSTSSEGDRLDKARERARNTASVK